MSSTPSVPQDPTVDCGPTADQAMAIKLANAVCFAYAAFNLDNLGQSLPPLPGYSNLQTINVYEATPNNVLSVYSGCSSSAAEASQAQSHEQVGSEAAPLEAAAPFAGCLGSTSTGPISAGSQVFGFTATSNDGSHNILILRGTVTKEEASYDLFGWGSNVTCELPTAQGGKSPAQTGYGQVNGCLWNFYSQEGTFDEDSLATSCYKAVQNLGAPNKPWFIASHSLGGAMAMLAAMDGTLGSWFGSDPVTVYTFGSLHLGDETFASNYTQTVGTTFRIANLCDFVPSFVSLTPTPSSDPYVHAGTAGTFIWQTWDDWGNHSLANIYLPVVTSHWDVIKWGIRSYPQ